MYLDKQRAEADATYYAAKKNAEANQVAIFTYQAEKLVLLNYLMPIPTI